MKAIKLSITILFATAFAVVRAAYQEYYIDGFSQDAGDRYEFKKDILSNVDSMRVKFQKKTQGQNQLLNYFSTQEEASTILRNHNKRFNFAPKHLTGEAIIPYTIHYIWLTDPNNPKNITADTFENIWDTIRLLNKD